MATQTTIRWGLKVYPSNNGCNVNAGATVPIADNNAAMIAAGIAATGPNGSTPTRTAELNAATYLTAVADPNPKFILLATDGLPNCAPGMANAADDTAGAVMAVTTVAGMGIPTFVVGVATAGTAADTTLSMMATAGGRPRMATPPYYPVSTTSDLVSALSTIGGMITSCSFGLGSKPPDPTNIKVTTAGGGDSAGHHPHEWVGLRHRTDVDHPLRQLLRHGQGRTV